MSEEEARKRQIEAARATREYAPVMAQEVSMSEHTERWEARRGSGNSEEAFDVISYEEEVGVSLVARISAPDFETRQGRARLIAAAPVLLAALERMRRISPERLIGWRDAHAAEECGQLDCPYCYTDEAIKEAKGE